MCSNTTIVIICNTIIATSGGTEEHIHGSNGSFNFVLRTIADHPVCTLHSKGACSRSKSSQYIYVLLHF